MTDTLTMEKLIAFLKVDLMFACCWPIPVTATKFQIICNKIFRWFCVIHGTLAAMSMMYTLWINQDNMYVAMKISCLVIAGTHIPLQILLYAFEHDRLQIIIHKMETFIDIAKSEERDIFQRYIDKCKFFYGMTMSGIAISPIAIILGPFVLDQPFPMEIQYPFDVEQQPLKTIIYLHHILIVYQAYVQVCSNVFVALLLWFLVARFEILSCKFRKVTNISEFAICVKQHQQLLRYAKDVTVSLRFVTLAAIIATIIAVMFAGMTFLSRQPLIIKTQFLTLATSALMEVFLCAWPADYLLDTSSKVSKAAYESTWFNTETSLQKDLLYVIARSQQPVTVNVPCMLPTLSLNYYASFLSTTFSYLTTCRAIIEDES